MEVVVFLNGESHKHYSDAILQQLLGYSDLKSAILESKAKYMRFS
jgi:hypothetical protein